jgi:CheY-like chemotaxis protein
MGSFMPFRREETNPTILLVEDDAIVAAYIGDILGELQFVVVGIASTGPEAISIAEINRVHLALVDVRIAGPMSGIELAQQLHWRFNIPTIFLAEPTDPAHNLAAETTQPLRHIGMPFRASNAYNTICAVLGHAKEPFSSPMSSSVS